MSIIDSFMRTPGVIERPGAAGTELDDMGEPVSTGTVSSPVVCDVQLKTSTEVSDGGAIYATGTLRGYFPPETDVRLKDARLVLDSGEAFTFDGDGWLVRDPFGGGDAFVTAPLQRVS